MAVTGEVIIHNGAEYMARQVRAATEAGLKAAVTWWWKVYMPKHWEVEANRRYGYQKRRGDDEPPVVPSKSKRYGGKRMVANQAYSWRKRRMKRHNRPLVYSGRSEMEAKRAIKIRVRSEKKSGLLVCTGAMAVPAYFYKYKPGQPDKYAELTRTIPEEVGALLAVHNAEVERYLRTMPTKTERIAC